jgi:hypothetical protein
MACLTDVLGNLDRLYPEAVLHAAHPWSSTSTAAVTSDDESPEGLAYLLEIDLAQQVIDVWSTWREGRQPTNLEKCLAIIYYAEHDTYLPIETADPMLRARRHV